MKPRHDYICGFKGIRLWGERYTFMGRKVYVYGEKGIRLWGKGIRLWGTPLKPYLLQVS